MWFNTRGAPSHSRSRPERRAPGPGLTACAEGRATALSLGTANALHLFYQFCKEPKSSRHASESVFR